MNDWTHRTMIVPAAYVGLARSLAAGVAAGDSGKGMWTTPLSASGAGEPSHFISAGLIWPEFADLLESAPAIYQAAGGQVPLPTIEAMLAASTIREDADPHALVAELGLKIIQPPEAA